jgi:selenocysteine lyase/cysteine desulfurase
MLRFLVALLPLVLTSAQFLPLNDVGDDGASTAPATLPECEEISQLPAVLPAPISQFYVPKNVSYMNTATLGPMPRAALKCAVSVWEGFESDPVNMYPWSSGTELDQVRQRAAVALSSELVDEIALSPSTTVSLNMVGEGLVASGFLKPGANVLTTDQEHGGGLAVWTHWQGAGYVAAIDKVAVPYGLAATVDTVVEAFASALDAAASAGKPYSVVAVSHVLTTTGLKLPLPEISALVKAHGALLVVDGAQAPGGISVNLNATGADVYTVPPLRQLP